MRHFASRRFWQRLENLPDRMQRLARRNYQFLKQDPARPSLHFKEICSGRYRSVRVGLRYRALDVPEPEGVQWFWIGTHEEYDKLISQLQSTARPIGAEWTFFASKPVSAATKL